MTATPFPDAAPVNHHSARGALYGTLATMFVYPTTDALAELTAPEATEGIRTAAETLGYDDETGRLLDGIESTDVETLQGSYNDLFGIPDSDNGGYEVVPYEAEYTVGDEVSLKQRRIATVSGLLDAFDLQLSDTFAERHDHVALELELMQIISVQRSCSLAADEYEHTADLERIEATLLDHHLSTFVPAMVHDLREATEQTVYLAAGALAETLVTDDTEAHPPTDIDLDGELHGPAGVNAR
jgi:TorA maturation chaperone TorD